MTVRRSFKPRIAPDGFADLVGASLIGAAMIGVLFVLPSMLVGVLLNPGAGLLTFAALYVVWLLFTVRRLDVDEEGIHFVRVLGEPRLIRWTDIDSIDEVGPAEVVLRAFMVPPFPPREMTAAFTLRGHLRIRYRKNVRGSVVDDAYFPPREAGEFAEFVRANSIRDRANDAFPAPAAPSGREPVQPTR